jgi:hypothetical protein
MKERLQQLLSEAGESLDYIRSDIRNLSRYMAELEELVEVYRAFALNATLTMQNDRVTRRKILKKTQKVVGPPPEKQPEKDAYNTADQKTERTEPKLPGGNSNAKRAKSAHIFWKLSMQTLWQNPPR